MSREWSLSSPGVSANGAFIIDQLLDQLCFDKSILAEFLNHRFSVEGDSFFLEKDFDEIIISSKKTIIGLQHPLSRKMDS